jgi:hypothetical protein
MSSCFNASTSDTSCVSTLSPVSDSTRIPAMSPR